MKELYGHIVKYNEANDNYLRLLGAGICILIVNVTGYLVGDYSINAQGSLGLFTFINYSTKDGSRIMKRLLFVGSLLIIGNILGMLASLSMFLPPIVVGFIAFLSRMLYRIFQIERPGDVFVIIAASAGTTQNVSLEEIPHQIVYIMFGIVTSLIIGYLLLKIENVPKQSYTIHSSIKDRIREDPRLIVDSFYYAATLFFASYITLALAFGAYSWMVVSCSAILQGNTLLQIVSRNFQRIIGTSCGLVTAAILLAIDLPILTKIFIIAICFMMAEYFIPHNYSIGIFFITNMLMIQMTLGSTANWPQLLGARFIGITVGSLLGVVSAFIQYRLYHFYSQSLIQKRIYDCNQELSKFK